MIAVCALCGLGAKYEAKVIFSWFLNYAVPSLSFLNF